MLTADNTIISEAAAIDSCRQPLVESINPRDLACYLFSHDLISKSSYDEIQNPESFSGSRRAKNIALLEQLKSINKGFDSLVCYLKEQRFAALAAKLENEKQNPVSEQMRRNDDTAMLVVAEYYANTFSLVKQVGGSKAERCQDFYVNMAFNDQELKESSCLNNTNYVIEQMEMQAHQLLIISANAGYGKTLLVKSMASAWAEAKRGPLANSESRIAKLQAVMVVVLRSVPKCKTLREAFTIQCSSKGVALGANDAWQGVNENDILFLLDGLDEYKLDENKRGNCEELDNILFNCSPEHMFKLPGNIVITTRPHVLENVVSPFSELKIYGIPNLSRQHFLPLMDDSVFESWTKNNLLVRSLMNSGMMLRIFGKFFSQDTKLPTNKYVLFDNMLNRMLDHSKNKPSRLKENYRGWQSIESIQEVGRLALYGLLNRRSGELEFRESLLATFNIHEDIYEIGILEKLQDGPESSSTLDAPKAAFQHKSLQEFMAAWYAIECCKIGKFHIDFGTGDDYTKFSSNDVVSHLALLFARRSRFLEELDNMISFIAASPEVVRVSEAVSTLRRCLEKHEGGATAIFSELWILTIFFRLLDTLTEETPPKYLLELLGLHLPLMQSWSYYNRHNEVQFIGKTSSELLILFNKCIKFDSEHSREHGVYCSNSTFIAFAQELLELVVVCKQPCTIAQENARIERWSSKYFGALTKPTTLFYIQRLENNDNLLIDAAINAFKHIIPTVTTYYLAILLLNPTMDENACRNICLELSELPNGTFHKSTLLVFAGKQILNEAFTFESEIIGALKPKVHEIRLYIRPFNAGVIPQVHLPATAHLANFVWLFNVEINSHSLEHFLSCSHDVEAILLSNIKLSQELWQSFIGNIGVIKHLTQLCVGWKPDDIELLVTLVVTLKEHFSFRTGFTLEISCIKILGENEKLKQLLKVLTPWENLKLRMRFCDLYDGNLLYLEPMVSYIIHQPQGSISLEGNNFSVHGRNRLLKTVAPFPNKLLI